MASDGHSRRQALCVAVDAFREPLLHHSGPLVGRLGDEVDVDIAADDQLSPNRSLSSLIMAPMARRLSRKASILVHDVGRCLLTMLRWRGPTVKMMVIAFAVHLDAILVAICLNSVPGVTMVSLGRFSL